MNDQEKIKELEYLNNEHRGVISILMDEREVLRERIAELEKGLELVKDAYCARDSECKELKGRIAELEKQLQESAIHNISVTAQADEHYARVKELEKEADRLSNHANQLRKIHADRIAELENEISTRSWVRKLVTQLSDEEILNCWHEYGQMLTFEQIRIAFGRAIEAKVLQKK